MTASSHIIPPLRKTVWKDILRLLMVGLFFLSAALLLNDPFIREQLFNIDALRNELQGSGWQGVAIFVATASVVNTLGIPKIWIAAAAGTLFGAVAGVPISLISCLVGSAANFFMGRYLLRGPVNRHMPRRLRHWYAAFNRHGFQTILYLRLFPFTNATLTNIVGGASQISFRDYIAATAIGYLPITIAFTIMGSSAAKQSGWQLAAGLGLFAAVALGQWMWHRLRKRRNKNSPVRGIMAEQKMHQPPMEEAAKL